MVKRAVKSKKHVDILSRFHAHIQKKNMLIPYSEYVKDDASGRMVLHVTNLPMFIQAIGDVKYNICRGVNGEENGWRVFYRGETSLQPMSGPYRASLYRPVGGKAPRKERADARIGQQINLIKAHCANMARLDSRVVEGVLQHYGLKSRWLDAVDNIWNALWFSCHDVWKTGHDGEYIHYERRNPLTECKDRQFCYIVLLGINTEGMSSKGIPGYLENSMGAVLDLRYALPSFFIRPHVQHGVLVRLREKNGSPALELGDMIKGIIRISLPQALEWLGESASLSVGSMFPPPALDCGLVELIRAEESIQNDPTRQNRKRATVKLQRIC